TSLHSPVEHDRIPACERPPGEARKDARIRFLLAYNRVGEGGVAPRESQRRNELTALNDRLRVAARRLEARLGAHPRGVDAAPTPRTARRFKLTAAARSAKSCATLERPRTRALRPPWRRNIMWLSLRSTFGRVDR